MSTDTYRTVRATVTLATGDVVADIYAGAVTDDENLAAFKRRARATVVERAAYQARRRTVGARVVWTVEPPR